MKIHLAHTVVPLRKLGEGAKKGVQCFSQKCTIFFQSWVFMLTWLAMEAKPDSAFLLTQAQQHTHTSQNTKRPNTFPPKSFLLASNTSKGKQLNLSARSRIDTNRCVQSKKGKKTNIDGCSLFLIHPKVCPGFLRLHHFSLNDHINQLLEFECSG